MPELETTETAQPEAETTAPPAAETQETETNPPAAADPKAQSREGYEARKARQEADALRQELEGYKRREDEARKAKLTDQQRLQEERDQLAQENERMKIERMQNKIALEFKLPPALAARLIGTNEDALRADAEDLAKLLPKPKVGTTTDPVREPGNAKTYKRSELAASPELARSPEVLQAAREGRITND